MRFVELDTGCMVCVSHKHNPDGYLRKSWGNARSGDLDMEMFHRFIYRAHYGPIPDDYEVDHTCRVRGCCNPKHLKALLGAEHASKGNRERYAYRKEAAHLHWLSNPTITGTLLGELFRVSFGCGCGWIKEWKQQHVQA